MTAAAGARDRVAEICREAARRGDEPLRGRAGQVLRRLDEPLRVAVAGRVSAGKSTLINALLEREIAQTGTTEITQLVTWYRAGDLDAVRVHLRSGDVEEIRLENGRIPAELHHPVTDVGHLEVTLSDAALADLTVIDTPGLQSAATPNSERSEALLDASRMSVDAALQADALVYVFGAALRNDERDILSRFGYDLRGRSAINVVGVLSKIDTLVDVGKDPWPEAGRLAGRFAEELGGIVTGIMPVIGLLAETTRAAAFTEFDATAIASLAELPTGTLDRLFLSHDRFISREAPVSVESRSHLVRRLDLHGIRLAIDAARGGKRGAIALGEVLDRASGFQDVKSMIDDVFRHRADLIKAGNALNQLAQLAWDRTIARADRMWLADLVESGRLEPAMHALAELQVANDILSGVAVLPPHLAEALQELASGGSAAQRLGELEGTPEAQLLARARALSNDFRSFAFTAAPKEAQVARVADRSCQLIITELVREGGQH